MPPELLSNSRHTELPHTPLWKHGFRRCRVGVVHAVIVYEAGPKVVPPSPRLITKSLAPDLPSTGNRVARRQVPAALRLILEQCDAARDFYSPLFLLPPSRNPGRALRQVAKGRWFKGDHVRPLGFACDDGLVRDGLVGIAGERSRN